MASSVSLLSPKESVKRPWVGSVVMRTLGCEHYSIRQLGLPLNGSTFPTPPIRMIQKPGRPGERAWWPTRVDWLDADLTDIAA